MKPDKCPNCGSSVVKTVFNTDYNDPHFMCGSILTDAGLQHSHECRLQAALNSMRKDVLDLQAQRDKAHNILRQIAERLKGPASNMRFMQIAGPARECRNLIKHVLG